MYFPVIKFCFVFSPHAAVSLFSIKLQPCHVITSYKFTCNNTYTGCYSFITQFYLLEYICLFLLPLCWNAISCYVNRDPSHTHTPSKKHSWDMFITVVQVHVTVHHISLWCDAEERDFPSDAASPSDTGESDQTWEPYLHLAGLKALLLWLSPLPVTSDFYFFCISKWFLDFLNLVFPFWVLSERHHSEKRARRSTCPRKILISLCI